MSGKKYYDYRIAHKLKAFNDTFTAFFPFDEVEYERRKQEGVNSISTSGKADKNNLVRQERDRYIRYIIDNCPDLKRDDIARIGKINVKTVYNASIKQDTT